MGWEIAGKRDSKEVRYEFSAGSETGTHIDVVAIDGTVRRFTFVLNDEKGISNCRLVLINGKPICPQCKRPID